MSPPRSRSRRATGSDRIACLLVPDLALRAALRAEPALANDVLVIASGRDGRAQILAVSPLAARLGLEAGRSLAHARAVTGELCVRVTSPALERAARDALLDVALSLSPRAALEAQTSGSFANEAAVLLDASGVETLFESEARFASVLREHTLRSASQTTRPIAYSSPRPSVASSLLCPSICSTLPTLSPSR